MIMNRIADVFFIFGIIILLIQFKTVNFNLFFEFIPFIEIFQIYIYFGYSFNLNTIVCFFLFIGAIGKSAQIGLHT
jgi:NADH:ubiquinone oxidoreductase subunit 5 (subunit L)/multisubunit Na+/H+ antiporter MnhA subunit